MNRLRGFKVVAPAHRKFPEIEIIRPVRSDVGSAGYDFYLPKTIGIEPNESVMIASDIKAYMQPDEVLYLHIRSNIGIKKRITLTNDTGVIDNSYYENPDNDGNIHFSLVNTSDKTVWLNAGDRIVQGVFHKFLPADDDQVLHDERTGGIGSSNRPNDFEGRKTITVNKG